MRGSYLTALVFLSQAALATAASAENPIYVTGKLGNTWQDARLGDRFVKFIDGDDNSWSFGLGLRFGKYVAFQAEYHDFGSAPGQGSPCPQEAEVCIATLVPVEADSTAISVTVLPHLPLSERFSVYGKLGFVSWGSDVFAIRDGAGRLIEGFSDEDLVYGVGLRLQVAGAFGAFAEYERIADIFDTVSLGATFGF